MEITTTDAAEVITSRVRRFFYSLVLLAFGTNPMKTKKLALSIVEGMLILMLIFNPNNSKLNEQVKNICNLLVWAVYFIECVQELSPSEKDDLPKENKHNPLDGG